MTEIYDWFVCLIQTPEIRAGNEGRNCNETNMEDKESKHEFPSEELKMHKGYYHFMCL